MLSYFIILYYSFIYYRLIITNLKNKILLILKNIIKNCTYKSTKNIVRKI